jgi:hypothetical protein
LISEPRHPFCAGAPRHDGGGSKGRGCGGSVRLLEAGGQGKQLGAVEMLGRRRSTRSSREKVSPARRSGAGAPASPNSCRAGAGSQDRVQGSPALIAVR